MTKEKMGKFKRNSLMDKVDAGRYLSNEKERAAYEYFYNRKPYQYTIAEPKGESHGKH